MLCSLPTAEGFLGAGEPVVSFAFTDPPLQVAGATNIAVSSPVANLPATTTATIAGGVNPQVSATGTGAWAATASIAVGGTIYARAGASTSWNVASTSTVTIGTGQASFTITTATIPTYNMASRNVSPAVPGQTYTTASMATGSNYSGIPSASGSGSPGTAGSPSAFTVHADASYNFGNVRTIAVTLGTYTSNWTLTTPNTPSMSLSGANITGAATGQGPYGNLLTVNGMAAGVTYTLDASGFGNPRFSRNQTNWVSTLNVTSADNGNAVFFGMDSSNLHNTTNTGTITISLGAASATGPSWSITTG